MNKLKTKLENLLKKNPDFLDSESRELNYIKVKDSASKLDKALIKLLVGDNELKKKFFTKIEDIYIFNIQNFNFFLDESRINNSYTQYANKIGLADHDGLIENRSEVVLDFPFKDCVLEGGQSTEEGSDKYFEYSSKAKKYVEKSAKRNEIFFNQVLAHDEIDRLYDRKALVGWKRFTKDGNKDGEAVKKIKRDKTGLIQENLIIKGNNLLALHSLKSEFSGKIKLIYIDPPYNTGSDSFRYNDNFNHSTWLTFMKNRLEIAKDLLRDDGVIFIQCDDHEQAYLKVLIDEIQEIQFKNCITIKMNESKGLKNAHIDKKLPKSKEYILVYSKNNFFFNPQKIKKSQEELKGYVKYYCKEISNIDNDVSLWKINDFSGSLEDKISNAKKLIYLVEPDNDVNLKSQENSFTKITNSKKNENYYYSNGKDIKKVLFLSENLDKFIGDLWTDISTININKEGGIQVLSKGQKPEKIIQRIIELSTKHGDLVLDYHLGSGTTCAVAHKMNRRYIGIEQLDYGKSDSLVRLKNVIDGDKSGVSKDLNWQGGGDFIYCELAKWNEKAKEEIQKAKDLSALKTLFDKLYEKYFLNYNVKVKDFKEKIAEEKEFKKLTLPEQKKMFLTMLDLNQMYVQKTEMADKKYGISAEDQKLTQDFYSKK